jgi:hypothetical protein
MEERMWRVKPQAVIIRPDLRFDFVITDGGRCCLDVYDGQRVQRVVFSGWGNVLRIRDLTEGEKKG